MSQEPGAGPHACTAPGLIHSLWVNSKVLPRAAQAFLDRRVPWTCSPGPGHHAQHESFDPSLAVSALRAASAIGPPIDGRDVGWEVGQILDRLEQDVLDSQVLAELEVAALRGARGCAPAGRPRERALLREATLFVQLISIVYRREAGEEDESIALAPTPRRSQAWAVLHEIGRIPGGEPGGPTLEQWIAQARTLLLEAGVRMFREHALGELLARSPLGEDGSWPAEAVATSSSHRRPATPRRARHGSVQLRGATMRGVDDGGAQEHHLARAYRRDQCWSRRSGRGLLRHCVNWRRPTRKRRFATLC